MAILDKVLGKPGIKADKVLDEFSTEQVEGIYPALSPVMVQVLLDELDLMSYLEIQDGTVTASIKGEAKLDEFKRGLSKEEREALGI